MVRIIEEREDLLVIDKPAGLIVHSDGRTQEPSLAEWIAERYPAQRDIGEWISPQGERVPLAGIAHRLDRSTSGVMLVAKTKGMYDYLKEEFKARRIEKIYCAYVYGHMEEKEGTIVAEIMRSSTPPRRWYARPCELDDKRAAITEWKLIENIGAGDEAAAYLELYLKTGRTHQIRVHMASIGHAVVADSLYAPDKPAILGFTRPALHAHQITLTLPDGQTPVFQAPPPPDFQNASKT